MYFNTHYIFLFLFFFSFVAIIVLSWDGLLTFFLVYFSMWSWKYQAVNWLGRSRWFINSIKSRKYCASLISVECKQPFLYIVATLTRAILLCATRMIVSSWMSILWATYSYIIYMQTWYHIRIISESIFTNYDSGKFFVKFFFIKIFVKSNQYLWRLFLTEILFETLKH